MSTKSESIILDCAIARNNAQNLTNEEWRAQFKIAVPDALPEFIDAILYEAKCLRYASYGWEKPEK